MKKMKRMLIGTLLVFTLCMLTACGNDNNNAADEVQNNANEDAIDKDNVENGTAEDENMVDDAGDSVPQYQMMQALLEMQMFPVIM